MNVHGKANHVIELREARVPGRLLQAKFDTVTGNDTYNMILISHCFPPVIGGMDIWFTWL